MGIKSKKFDGHEGKIRVLFSKGLRITSCFMIILCMAAYICSWEYKNYLGIKEPMEENYTNSAEYHNTLMDEYEQLCIYSAFYLSNMSSEGKFTGNKYLLSDFLYYLDYNSYKYRKTDDGIKLVSELFNYYVSYKNENGEISFSTNFTDDYVTDSKNSEDDKIEQLKQKNPSYILRRNGIITSDKVSSGDSVQYSFPTAESGYYCGEHEEEYDEYDEYDDYYYEYGSEEEYSYETVGYEIESYSSNFVPIGGWYYDNYGRYFYNFGNSNPIRFYSQPKNTEKGKIARDGCVYRVEDYQTGDTQIISVDNYNSVVSYDEQDYHYQYLYLENLSDYKAYNGDENAITVFISPKQDITSEMEAVYTKTIKEYNRMECIITVSEILICIFMLYSLFACGYAGMDENGIVWKNHKVFGKIPADLYLIFAFVGIIIISNVSVNDVISLKDSIISICLTLVTSLAGIFSCVEIVNFIKTSTFLENFLVVKIIKKVITKYKSSDLYKKMYDTPSYKKLIFRTIIIGGCCLIAVIALMVSLILEEYGLIISVVLIVGIIVIVELIKFIRDFYSLMKLDKIIQAMGTNQLCDEKISERSVFYNEYVTLNNISQKVAYSVEEQIKSERMKIELIANVSHDLKTPLTSIISYIDLLKKEELSEEAGNYVKILDEKSQKLKGIVADVFTLAKATSGIDVNLAKIDFVMLFNQAMADEDDKIREKGKIVVTKLEEKAAFVMADGDKMYRVFQNLMDNSLNYSMEGSRIFWEIKREGDEIEFITKNISSSPIDYTEDEIVERFVRGDKSRTDGGSGLGLSIAKTFTEACGGTFTIELDGDMFKTIVSLKILEQGNL